MFGEIFLNDFNEVSGDTLKKNSIQDKDYSENFYKNSFRYTPSFPKYFFYDTFTGFSLDSSRNPY